MHRATHPEPVEGCFGCKVLSISVSADALPNRGRAISSTSAKERVLAKDMDAYRRLRVAGEQPARIDGAASIERHAETKLEVTRSTLLNDRQRRQVETLRREGVNV